MKAIEALKQINAIFSEYVAIAKDENNVVYVYTSNNLESTVYHNQWAFTDEDTKYKKISPEFSSKIEWDSDNWDKCITTLNDIENEQV